MNKNIRILLFFILIISLLNNYNNYFIISKFSNIYEKYYFTFIINSFYYSGVFLGNLFFYNIYKIKCTSSILYFYFYLLTILFLIEIFTYDIRIIALIKFINGFLYNNICNNIETYINEVASEYSIFYNSIIYFSLFINQYWFSIIPKTITTNDNIYKIILLIMFFIKKYLLFVKDIDINKKNFIKFENLNFFNIITIIMIFLISFLLTLISNFMLILYKNNFTSKIISSVITISCSISYYYVKNFKKLKKKKIIMFILMNSYFFPFFVIYLTNKIIKSFLFFFYSINTFSVYYFSCKFFNKKKNKNNLLFTILNSFFYSISPYIFFFLYKIHFNTFLFFMKFFSFFLFYLLYLNIL